MDCGDIDAATSSQFNFNYPSCQATATAWGFSAQSNPFIQKNEGGAGNSASRALAFGTNNTVGNTIIVTAEYAGGFRSISDSQGNAYNTAVATTTSPGSNKMQIWYASNIKGGANTVTVNYTGSTYNDLFIFEYAGLGALDMTSLAFGTGTTATSGVATTNYPNELIFGFGIADSYSLSAGYLFVSRSTFDGDIAEDKISGLAGSYSATGTLSGSSGWAMSVATFRASGLKVTLTAPSNTAIHVATGTPITINIGSNATYQQQGTHWITNPSSPGVYTISVGGTFGGSGNILVSINSGQTVQATVAENLSFTASSVKAVNCTADDGATPLNTVTTTATSVPFGFISPNTFYQGCQDLSVSTNALGGYSLTVQEKYAMRTANGLYTIPDTTCDAGNCSVVTATTWVTPTKYGLGHTWWNVSGSDCNASYLNGTKFKPVPNIAGGTGPGTVMFIQSAGNNASSSSSLFIAPSKQPVAGDLIVVSVASYNQTVSNVTDNAGNTYTGLDINPVKPNNDQNVYLYMFYAKDILTAANFYILANTSGGPNEISAAMHEYAGADKISPLDQRNSYANPYAGRSQYPTSNSVTTTISGEAYVGAMTHEDSLGCGTSVTTVAGTTYTLRQVQPASEEACSHQPLVTEDKIGPAQTTAATYTLSGNDYWAAIIAAFKPMTGANPAMTLMSNTGPAVSTSRAKYRLSASPNQPAGTYTTVITYTLTPTY